MSSESERNEAWILDCVQLAMSDGLSYSKIAEIVGGVYDKVQYETRDFARQMRVEIAAQSLRLFTPDSTYVRTSIYKLFEDGRWKSTAELLASLAFAIDFIAHTAGEENAYWTLMTEHVGGPYPQVAI